MICGGRSRDTVPRLEKVNRKELFRLILAFPERPERMVSSSAVPDFVFVEGTLGDTAVTDFIFSERKWR